MAENSDNDSSEIEHICLKRIPKYMKERGVRKLCGSFGKITYIHHMKSQPFYVFVQYSSTGYVFIGIPTPIFV